ncbi:hypothetical protein [Oryzifoliimicrobium ureilyticus]|uniref:hypothetical protein n=1 Tax=Oryzifoliimicrobium ureilyticus TaxID=3113724 RepID=UPI0030762E7D
MALALRLLATEASAFDSVLDLIGFCLLSTFIRDAGNTAMGNAQRSARLQPFSF